MRIFETLNYLADLKTYYSCSFLPVQESDRNLNDFRSPCGRYRLVAFAEIRKGNPLIQTGLNCGYCLLPTPCI